MKKKISNFEFRINSFEITQEGITQGVEEGDNIQSLWKLTCIPGNRYGV